MRPHQRKRPAASGGQDRNLRAAAPGGSLGLQASIGNQAVLRMMRRDRGEEERPDSGERGHENAVQRTPDRSDVEAGLRAPGRPLDPPTLARKEEHFQADLSGVRLHSGAAAERAAAAVQARAFTVDQDIVIGKGGRDSKTLDHELTHAVRNQQKPSVGHPTGGGFSMTHTGDAEEREADANSERMSSGGPSSVQGEGAGMRHGTTAGAASEPHLQRYANDPDNPAAPQYDEASGDQLPAFAVNQPMVTVRIDEQGAFQGSLSQYGEAEGPVTLSWSNDQTVAMNSQLGAKEFYATAAVLDAANKSLAEAGSYVRLAPGGHSLTSPNGNRLTVVRPRAAGDRDEAVLTKFMHLVQNECVEVAEKLTTGRLLDQGIFRGPDGKGVTAPIGTRGASLPRLADALTSSKPPMTPEQAAQAVQTGDPTVAPGEAYGTSLREQRLQQQEQAIGINEHARGQVGEALTTQTIGSSTSPGEKDTFDYSRNRVHTGRIWSYHYATLVAQSSDGADQITMENFNRSALMEGLLQDAAEQTAQAYVKANPGEVMPAEKARQVARRLLEQETKSAMGDMWYFKMYEPGGERSFHAKNRDDVLNPMTVATTNIPHLRFEKRSDILTPLSKSQLQRTAEMWRQSSAPIVVEGHARGSAFALRKLAEKRAEAVVAELVRQGIARNRITMKTNSKSNQPFASVYPADRPEHYVPGPR
ncbi:DUF4157 domain-containing protein [Streptomyces achromogenes]|uniref:eCIS core domain-containing protein n=1 Tax=Streptomyces achromogenes TaxID=67255 RepID=UPI0036F8BFA4